MFNFLRRSKTKDHIEYNRNDSPKEKFNKLCQELDVANALTNNSRTTLLLKASTSCSKKDTTEVALPTNDGRKTIESGKQRSATLTSQPLPNVNNERNVISSNPPSLSTSVTSTNRRFINPNPYVANICDLVHLTNETKQKKIGDTFKDIMAPAIGWRNKNKNSKKGKNKNQQTVNNSPVNVMGNSSGTQTQKISDKKVTKEKNFSEITKNKDTSVKINKPTNISKCNNDSTIETSLPANITATSVEKRPVKPPRVEKNNSILRASSQQIHSNNTNVNLQQKSDDENVASETNSPQQPNINRKTSNSSNEFANESTLEIFLPPDITTITEIDSKNSSSVLTKQNNTLGICASLENSHEKQKSSEYLNSTNNNNTNTNTHERNFVKNVDPNSNTFKNKTNDVPTTKPSIESTKQIKNNKKNIMGNQKSTVDSKIMNASINQPEEINTNKAAISNVSKINQNSINNKMSQGTQDTIKETINKNNEEHLESGKKPEIVMGNGEDAVKSLKTSENYKSDKKPQDTNTPKVAFTQIKHDKITDVVNNQFLRENMPSKSNESGRSKVKSKDELESNENLEDLSQEKECASKITLGNNNENDSINDNISNISETTNSILNTNIKNDSTITTVTAEKVNVNNLNLNIENKINIAENNRSINNNVINDNDHNIKSDTTNVLVNSESINVPQNLSVCSQQTTIPQKIIQNDKKLVTSIVDPITSPIQNNSLENNEKIGNNQTTDVQTLQKSSNKNNSKGLPISNAKKIEMRNLVTQEERLKGQITELKKQLNERDTEAIKLKYDMDELQRNVYVKSSGMERLQAELIAANKESEYVRQRLRHVEDELQNFRDKNSDLADELSKKSEEITTLQLSHQKQVTELEEKMQGLSEKIQELEKQNEEIRKERDRIENQRLILEKERTDEKKLIQETLDSALKEKKQIQERWEKDFEKLRTVNTDREQQLLDDFEWKLREVEQTCKKRLEEKDKKMEEKIKQAYKDIEVKVKTAETQLSEALRLKSYEAEVKQLRGLTDDQQKSLRVTSQKIEELQVAEEILKKEIEKLKRQIEAEKGKVILLNHEHKQALTSKERELLVKLEAERGEVAQQWEERLHQECLRLKLELEQIHNEEKMFAIEAIKNNKDEEFNEQKKEWEQIVKECNQQIAKLKNEMSQKEETYIKKIEQMQTNTDRDIMELRRTLDKSDMSYNNQIDKLTEDHEREIERLTEEHERKIKELEANWQMQIASTRTTLELVKEQMERDAQNKLQELDQHHQNQLKLQWEQLVQDKEEALQQMEQKYRINSEKLKEEISNIQKLHNEKEMELLISIDNLKSQLDEKKIQINCLQSNVDTLQGGIQVLNREIKNHGDEIIKMEKDCENKVRSLRDNLLAEQIRRINQQKEQHKNEITKIEQNARSYIEKLQKKYLCLTKLFEEMQIKYKEKDLRIDNNIKELSKLKQIISAHENEIKKLTEENEKYKLQIEQCMSKEVQRTSTRENINNENVITQDQIQKSNKNTKKCEVITIINSQENVNNSCN